MGLAGVCGRGGADGRDRLGCVVGAGQMVGVEPIKMSWEGEGGPGVTERVLVAMRQSG